MENSVNPTGKQVIGRRNPEAFPPAASRRELLAADGRTAVPVGPVLAAPDLSDGLDTCLGLTALGRKGRYSMRITTVTLAE